MNCVCGYDSDNIGNGANEFKKVYLQHIEISEPTTGGGGYSNYGMTKNGIPVIPVYEVYVCPCCGTIKAKV